MKKVKIECHLCQPRYTRTTLKVSHWNKFRIANIYVTFRDHQQKILNIAKVFKKSISSVLQMHTKLHYLPRFLISHWCNDNNKKIKMSAQQLFWKTILYKMTKQRIYLNFISTIYKTIFPYVPLMTSYHMKWAS